MYGCLIAGNRAWRFRQGLKGITAKRLGRKPVGSIIKIIAVLYWYCYLKEMQGN